MNVPHSPAVLHSDTILRESLAEILSRHFGHHFPIARLQRKPIEYASSYSIEELTVECPGREPLQLIFKNVSPDARLPGSVDAKPAFLYSPLREIAAYRTILPAFHENVPRCYGASVDQHSGRYWLFIELITGDPLWQVGDPEVWGKAVRRLASMHAANLGRVLPEASAKSLLHYHRDFLLQWPHRAAQFSASQASGDQQFLHDLAVNYDRVLAPILAWPQTVVHGECYASNILHDPRVDRICFVDWEMAAIGSGLLDLAALTAGKWTADQKRELALLYHDFLLSTGQKVPSSADFLRALAHARLHIAVQWLGWSPTWTPPEDHQHNWLQESRDLAISLGLVS